MSKSPNDSCGDRQEPRPLPGFYRGARVSVRALDIVIVLCIAAILIVAFADIGSGSGFAVNFDSKGGSDVPSLSLNYGQVIGEHPSPSREGYVFTGWYRDSACFEPWDVQHDPIESDMTLYAGWEKAGE